MRKVSSENFIKDKTSSDVLTEMMLNLIGGGYSKGKIPANIRPKELAMGMEVEKEHTTDEIVAIKIALDHLTEIPDYYTRLAKMEEEAKLKS